MVDRTVYADDAHTPKIALRQIFGRMGLPQALCRSAADGGLLSVEIFAMLGDTAQAVKTSLRTMIAEADLGTTDAARELALMQLAAVWHACHASTRAVRHSACAHGRGPQQGSRDGARRSR